jgi:DNA replication and repair protein RecF
VILRSLQTLHYRNLESGRLSFRGGVTGIVGGNGQGKTNVLESAFPALTGVLDVSRVETVIRLGETEAFVGAEVERDDGITKLEVGLAPGKKLAKVDGARVKTADLARHASAVLIRPEDAELVHGSPSQRRAFLDALVSRMSPRYAQALQSYERVVSQRNAVLRQPHIQDWMLEVWDAKLVELGAELMRLRRRAVTRLKTLSDEAHAKLTGNGKKLELNLIETARLETYNEHLNEKRREELARGSTAIGPHRDDLEIKLDGLAALDYASRGEARTIALALRKAEYDLLSEKFKEPPVLLIDDFTAELDSSRRQFLLELAAAAPQAIVTGTEAPSSAARLYTIHHGALESVQSALFATKG